MKNYNSEKFFSFFIFIFAFALYTNSLFNKYSFDDKLVTSIHPQVQKGIAGIPEIFTTYYAKDLEKSFEYRPLTKATFAFEYEYFGANLFVSHLINVLLYSLTCLLLYHLTNSLFPAKGKFFAFIAILLFAVHPTHTEVVNSLKNREEILSFLFCLLAIHFFIKSAANKNFYFFIPAFVFFIFSLFTKLTSLPFLVIIPLCIFYLGEKNIRISFYIFALVSLCTLIYFVGINYMLPGVHNREIFFIENPIVIENSFKIIFLNSLQTMWLYLKLCIFPHPLLFYYGYDIFPVAKIITPEIVIAFLIYGFIFVYSIIFLRKRKVIAFAFLFYLLTMSMYFNLVFPAPGIIADRALYVPSFAFSLLIAQIFTRFSIKTVFFLCLLVIVPFSFKTISRNMDWKDNFTLMKKDMIKLKRSAKANLICGTALKNFWENEDDETIKKKYADMAIFYFHESLKVKPDMAIPYNEIGNILFAQYNNYAEAKEYYLKAIEFWNSNAEYHFNLATTYAFLQEYNYAEKFFLISIKINPDYSKAIHNLYLTYLNQREFKKAFQTNSVLLKKTPDELYPYLNFGKYYLAIGDSSNAFLYLKQADSISSGNKEVVSMLESFR